MENEDRPFAGFVNFWRICFEEYARFVWAFYGGVTLTQAVDPTRRSAQDAPKKAP
ncbi:hypothetical protein [Micromonospora halophytica]|uniref:Uncharacterized protein n=1 Tax=Micromonospora halophytica TaxID=47864 RepID=A0A1C5HK00_9ACTN|nr:hypothetical protein [Micromonospora halophytica]SCG46356.1 hypothetical protein GA0070560_104329 [Micromonospora halophytica]